MSSERKSALLRDSVDEESKQSTIRQVPKYSWHGHANLKEEKGTEDPKDKELKNTHLKLKRITEELNKVKEENSTLNMKLLEQQRENKHLVAEKFKMSSEMQVNQNQLFESEKKVAQLQQWKDAVQQGPVPGQLMSSLSSRIPTKAKEWTVKGSSQPHEMKCTFLEPQRQKELDTSFASVTTAQRETLELVSTYRQITGNNALLMEEKFVGDPSKSETAVVVLHDLLSSFGVALSCIPSEGGFKNVAGATENGVADFGAIHMLLDQDVHAQFLVKVQQDYDEFEEDIATSLAIDKILVRVQELGRGSVIVQFIISAPNNNRILVEQWANNLAVMLAAPASKVYSGRITRDVLPGRYDYGFVPVFHRFQVKANHFRTRWNFDYRNKPVEPSKSKRGGQPFYPPAGWYRHALDVSRFADQTWLGMKNLPAEWIVAYHGTKAENMASIIETQINPGRADAYRNAATQPRPNGLQAPIGSHSIYVSPDVAVCDLANYTKEIDVIDVNGQPKRAAYKIAFMCRIDPTKVTKHLPNTRTGTSLPRNEMSYWRVWDKDAVRPYGLLLKQTK